MAHLATNSILDLMRSWRSQEWNPTPSDSKVHVFSQPLNKSRDVNKLVFAYYEKDMRNLSYGIFFLCFHGRKMVSFHYPRWGALYKGEAIQRSLVESYTPPDSNETDWRENINTVVSWLTKEDFDCMTLYHGEPDNTGHQFESKMENRRVIIQQLDRTIGYLVEAIERHSLTKHFNVIITSDHGMTTVKKEAQCHWNPFDQLHQVQGLSQA